MLNNHALEIQLFLEEVHLIEAKVTQLIVRSGLSEKEKQYILDHILIVPGSKAL
ncbi:hypothetical protein [Paenibacillus caui]|uniref:hypothetical protein n=1 Tax=Paenibacillus caui TaxID=2873927 RepID=UPI001CA96090|nr:hypothetical protein [Paenibacillus caui]